ncbi:MAG: hypothetical protein ACIAQU_00005 [Phycisphaerales bacterium JB064]
MFGLAGCGESGSDAPATDGSAGTTGAEAATEPATPDTAASDASTEAAAEEPEPVYLPDLPTEGEIQAEGFDVLWAAWGDNERQKIVDVTEFVRTTLREHGYVTSTLDANYNEVGGDPMPGMAKWLTFALKTPSGVIVGGVQSDSHIRLRSPQEMIVPYKSEGWKEEEANRANELLVHGSEAAPTGLVWARWGNDGRWAGWGDAYEPVARQVEDEGRIYNKRANMGIPRPNATRGKTLRILAAVDGQPITGHLRDSSYLILRPTEEQAAAPQFVAFGPAGQGMPHVTAMLTDVEVARYLVAPDGRSLFVLPSSGDQVLKVDGETFEVLATLDGFDAAYQDMTLSIDGSALYLGGPQEPDKLGREQKDGRGWLAEIDPQTLEMRGQPRTVRCDIVRLGAMADGRVVALHGGRRGETVVIDPKSGVDLKTHSTWGSPGAIMFHPDGERVYLTNNSQMDCRWYGGPGVSEGGFLSLNKPAGAVTISRGEAWLLDDGRHVLSTQGQLVALSNGAQDHHYGLKSLEPTSGGVISETLGTLTLSVSGMVRVYSWPGMEPLGQSPAQGQLGDLRLRADGTSAWAMWMPNATVERGGISGDRTAQLVVLDLEAMTPEGHAAFEGEITPEEDGNEAIAVRLPLRTHLRSLMLSRDGDALYALDVINGQALRLDPESLEVVQRSEALPFGAWQLAMSQDDRTLVVSVAPTAFDSNKENEGGSIIRLDPNTLEPMGEAMPVEIDPYDMVVAGNHVFISGGSNQSTEMHQLDLSQGMVTAKLAGIYQRSPLELSPDGSLLILTTNGISPSSANTVPVPDSKGLPERIGSNTVWGEGSGGEIWVADNGAIVVMQGGAVYKADTRGNTLDYVGKLDALTGMAGSSANFFVARGGDAIVRYDSNLRAISSLLLSGVFTDLAFDLRRNRLYAIHRPAAKAEGGGRLEPDDTCDIVAIDLSKMPR